MIFVKENFDWLCYFINSRHQIYLDKEAGKPKPWSNDPIFQNWSFCNIFRQLDKQTKSLQQHVIQPHCNDDKGLLLFNIFAFRAFNWYQTYERIGGYQYEWIPESIKFRLANHIREGNQLTSGAYMIRGREGEPKYSSIVDSLTDIWSKKEHLIERIGENCTLEKCQEILLWQHFWGWSDFTCYQIVLDLLYSPILEGASDVNTWCAFGPGSKKGLQYIWPDIKESEMLEATKQLLEWLPQHLEPHVPTIDLQTVQFCLCELSKMIRIRNGGHGKHKYAGTEEKSKTKRIVSGV